MNPFKRPGPPPPVVPTSNLRLLRPRPNLSNTEDPRDKKEGGFYEGNSNPFNTRNRTTGGVPFSPPTGRGMPTGAPAAPQKTNDELAEDAIRELLQQGPRDTSGDEAAIQKQLEATVGQGQADLNARLGAGGFGTSGALGAISGDMRRQNSLAASDKVMGLRKDARDEYLDKLMAGMEGEFKDRGMDMSEEQYNAYLDALLAANGIQGTGGPGQPSAAPAPSSTGSNTAYDGLTPEEAQAKRQHLYEQMTAGRAQEQKRKDGKGATGIEQVEANGSAQEVDTPPNGGQYVGTQDGYRWYVVTDYNGHMQYYKVRA